MEKTKNNKGLVVVIITLMVIILGLIFYISYDKGLILNNKKSTEIKAINSNMDKKEENVDINSSLIKHLLKTFEIDETVVTVDGLNNSNLTKLRIAYANISNSKSIKSIKCSDVMSDDDSSYCGIMNEEMSKIYNSTASTNSPEFKAAEANNLTSGVSQEDMEEELKWLFGSDFKIKHESFGLNMGVEPTCSYAKYVADKKVYANYYGECGGTSLEPTTKVISATKKGNILKINVDIILENTHSVTYEFKKDKINENYVFVKVEDRK